MADLVDEPSFGLTLLTGPDGWENRPVLGTHGSEVAEPMRWIQPGWTLLTTGMRLNQTQVRRGLVRELEKGRASAFGFGIGHSFDRVPKDVIKEAESVGLPLFEVPLATPFSEISAFAAQSAASQEFLQLRRVLSMQNYLFDSLQCVDPESELVQRLAQVLDSPVALFRADGQLRVVSDRPRNRITTDAIQEDHGRKLAWATDLWAELARRPTMQTTFTWRGNHVEASPVLSDAQVSRWLAIASSTEMTPLKKAVISASRNVLASAINAAKISAEHERMDRAQLLNQILEAEEGDPLDRLRTRLNVEGFDFSVPVRGVLIAAASRAGEARNSLRSIEDFCTSRQRAFLVASSKQGIYLLTPENGEDFDRVIAEALSGSGDLIGIGRPAASPDQLKRSLRDARIAIEHLRRQADPQKALCFENLDLAGSLLSDSSLNNVQEKVDELIAPLLKKPFLYETLKCFMSMNLDVSSTARALNLHPNSLRYRLNKIEKLVGGSLHDPAIVTNLHLAMSIESIIAFETT